MAVVTPAQEYKRLRSYLNPFIKGTNVDAVLNALASGMSSVLINNASAVNDNMYIVSAVGTYLDARLAEYGITRPSAVGLSDDVFTQIGLEVKNRKQVRDLMAEILQAIFGVEFVQAINPSRAVEPYNLQDGDTLIINYDANTTTTITFRAEQFENINAALAQEVADAITETLTTLNIEGTAISQNDGNGNYVLLISNTIGPRSSVTVMGGSAENQLLFDEPVAAAGDATTQWTVTIQPGGYMRFMWSGGTNPNVGDLVEGNYVNIYGGGFTGSTNAGTYTITSFVGGVVDVAYFQVYNPFGTPGIFTQGNKTAVLFYDPIKKTLNSIPSYAAIYQVSSALLQIFLPASTQVIRRSRVGAAYIHFPPQGTFQLLQQPLSGDIFVVSTTYSVTAGVDFVIGVNLAETVNNMVAEINAANVGLLAVANRTGNFGIDTVDVFNTSLSNTLVIAYEGYATGTFTFTGNSTIGDAFTIGQNTLLAEAITTPAEFNGIINGTATSVSLSANTAGSNGDNIILTFSGTNSINAAIATWNTANPGNQVTLTLGDGTQVPSAGTIQLNNAGFVIGGSDTVTATNLAAAISVLSGFSATAVGTVVTVTSAPPRQNVTLSYAGSAVVNTSGPILAPNPYVTASGPLGNNISLEPNQYGPYTYDLTQPFVVSAVNTKLAQVVNANTSKVIQVGSSAGFPNKSGYLIFGYGTSHQEGPVPYLGAPSTDTLWISPAYTFQNIQPIGTSVFLVAQKNPAIIDTVGDQYPFYLTDVVSGRIYAQDLIQSVAAAGIKVVFTILYPGDIGLGKWGTPYSEIPIIWGP